MSLSRIALLALGLVFLAAPAAAQDESPSEDEARHHFRLGEAQYESGHFLEAAHEFEEAYRLSQRPPLLHNIYVAYRDAGELEPAADALRRFLEVGHVENATILRRRLAELERLIAERNGEAPPEEDHSDASRPRSSSEPAREHASGPSASSADGGPSPIGWAVLGVGAAAVVAGAITGGVTLSVNDELSSSCPNRECPAGYDYESRTSTGSALALTTDILIPVGAVALATGVVLLLALHEDGDSPRAAAICGPDGCAATVTGRF